MDFTVVIEEHWGYWWCVLFALLTYLLAGLFGFLSCRWVSGLQYGYWHEASGYYSTYITFLFLNMVHLLAVAFRVQLRERYAIRVSNGTLSFTNFKKGNRPFVKVPLNTVASINVEPPSWFRGHVHIATAGGSTISVPYRTHTKALYLFEVLDMTIVKFSTAA